MTIGQPEAGDQVTRHGGQPLLIVDAAIVETLEGTEVDFQTGDENGTSAGGFMLRPAEPSR